MEKYENIQVVGEGSYGVVIKCRHRETGQLVAIKKFVETEENTNVRKMAIREIRMLKRLHHDNLVNLIEVFRRKRRFFLVFEYLDHTVLDEIEAHPGGLSEQLTREYMFQIVRGIHFIHNNNIIHRDMKPENVLVSSLGVVKICDFGFARLLVPSGDQYTDYVATRWYRAPELLVFDSYGRPVDVWALGCFFAEMLTGDPLFPGDSDIDMIYRIGKLLGKLCQRHQEICSQSPLMKNVDDSITEVVNKIRTLSKQFPTWSSLSVEFLHSCLRMDPEERATTIELLEHKYFTHDDFPLNFLPDLQNKVQKEFHSNPLIRRFQHSSEPEKIKGLRRPSNVIVPRWRISFADARTSDAVSPLLPINSRTNQLQNENDKSLKSIDSNLPMDVDETEPNNNSVKYSSLNKYSPLLSNYSGGSIGVKALTSKNSPETPTSPSPFLSLGSELLNLPTTNVHTTYLQPTVKTLNLSNGFRNETKMGIPRISQGVTLMPRTQLIRRLERDTTIDPDTTVNHLKQPNFRPHKNQFDDFSLPNLPGATTTPMKCGKKKLHPMNNSHGNQADSFISPRNYRSRSPSISPPGRFSSNLPMV